MVRNTAKDLPSKSFQLRSVVSQYIKLKTVKGIYVRQHRCTSQIKHFEHKSKPCCHTCRPMIICYQEKFKN